MSETLKTDGKLLGVNAVEQITDKFKKRKFWVETDSESQWPQVIEFELVQDKVDLIDKFKKGDVISVGLIYEVEDTQAKKQGKKVL